MSDLYGCLYCKETLIVEVLSLEKELELKWADGQIGAMPIFDSKEKALEYVGGDLSKIFNLKIVENNKD